MFEPQLIELGNGNHMLLWADSITATFAAGFDVDVRAQVFDATTGNTVGGVVTVNSTLANV